MSSLPIGTIILWPTDDAPPAGWLICDGTNGTPPLTGVLVPGAGGAYAVGDQGGSAVWVLPPHTHSLGTTALGGGSEAIHDHGWDFLLSVVKPPTGHAAVGITAVEPDTLHEHLLDHTSVTLVTGGGEHVHDLTGSLDAGGIASVPDKLPDSYAFHFIQRVS